MKSFVSHMPVFLRYTLGILVILAVSLSIFKVLMSPPLAELGLMAMFLAFIAVLPSVWRAMAPIVSDG